MFVAKNLYCSVKGIYSSQTSKIESMQVQWSFDARSKTCLETLGGLGKETETLKRLQNPLKAFANDGHRAWGKSMGMGAGEMLWQNTDVDME